METWGWWFVPWKNTNVVVWPRTYNKVDCPLLVRDPEHYFHIVGDSAIWKNSDGNRCLRWVCIETQNGFLHKTGTTMWTSDCLMTLDYLMKFIEKETPNSALICKNSGLKHISNEFCFKETSYIWDSEENSHPNYKSNCWKAWYVYCVKGCKKDAKLWHDHLSNPKQGKIQLTVAYIWLINLWFLIVLFSHL